MSTTLTPPAHVGATRAAPAPLPPVPLAPPLRRAAKDPRVMPYQRLIALVLLAGLAVACGLPDPLAGDGRALAPFSTLALVALAVAVLIRQPLVLTALFGLAGRASPAWPLPVRWSISKVHHVGGLHVGAALAGTAAFTAFTLAATATRARTPSAVPVATVVLAWSIVVVVLGIVACALPPVRRRAHDLFEASHRYGGWSAVALLWALLVQQAVSGRGGTPVAGALVSSWQLWLLAVLTASIALPWLQLRRVPVTVERPSAHAVLVSLDYGVSPRIASAVAISRSPVGQWHAFATVRTPGRPGYRLLVSRAGDWTGAFVDDPPTHVWVRGRPVPAPLAEVEVLYRRVVHVATGSGIGPCLGQVLDARVPARLVWSARSPRATYGDALVDAVERAQPDAVVWDTARQGKPDLLALTLAAHRDSGAEAVFVISNQPTTRRLVHALERRGIPAFGPIWDS